MAIRFSNTHDDGTVSEWTTESDADGDLNPSAASGLANTLGGVDVLIDDTNVAFLRETFTVLTGTDYRYRFYFDPNGITMASATRL